MPIRRAEGLYVGRHWAIDEPQANDVEVHDLGGSKQAGDVEYCIRGQLFRGR
jgi:hypothetical protein